VTGKKAVVLGGSLLEKLHMAWVHGCGEWPWLAMAASSDARVWARGWPWRGCQQFEPKGKKKNQGSGGICEEMDKGGVSGAPCGGEDGGGPWLGHAMRRRTA
jgi:hypothetical protein